MRRQLGIVTVQLALVERHALAPETRGATGAVALQHQHILLGLKGWQQRLPQAHLGRDQTLERGAGNRKHRDPGFHQLARGRDQQRAQRLTRPRHARQRLQIDRRIGQGKRQTKLGVHRAQGLKRRIGPVVEGPFDHPPVGHRPRQGQPHRLGHQALAEQQITKKVAKLLHAQWQAIGQHLRRQQRLPDRHADGTAPQGQAAQGGLLEAEHHPFGQPLGSQRAPELADFGKHQDRLPLLRAS